MQAVQLDFLHLTYRPDLQLLLLRWTRPVTSEEHRVGYNAALDLARAEKVGRWMIDLRTRGLASADDFNWVLTDMRAQFKPLPEPHRMAYLVTPYHAATITARLIEQEAVMPEKLRKAAVVRIFTEEQMALTWLRSA
ncbi:hypothetical protein [Hymenobacter koreensis]